MDKKEETLVQLKSRMLNLEIALLNTNTRRLDKVEEIAHRENRKILQQWSTNKLKLK